SGVQFYLMVHAGVAPQWNLRRTMELAAEVELALQGPEYLDFLRSMYGDAPAQWHNNLAGNDRLRVITNYLTRLRFCNDKGVMEMQIKEAASKAPEGFSPWFNFERITPTTNILFGHWAALEGVTGRPHVYALDTGCVWGRELTMMRLEDHKLFSV
ncbi:MAG: symmetrical bis(5'-nucleosyl)-tetraphosphatase, partial [Pseudohongiella sp.]|nr:symmetrical bis(5'-nucleosyl)-tetraphosphatase [Pseudohongiella sp.]